MHYVIPGQAGLAFILYQLQLGDLAEKVQFHLPEFDLI